MTGLATLAEAEELPLDYLLDLLEVRNGIATAGS